MLSADEMIWALMRIFGNYKFRDQLLMAVLTFVVGMSMIVAWQLGATMDMLLVAIAAGFSATSVKLRVLERQLAELTKGSAHD